MRINIIKQFILPFAALFFAVNAGISQEEKTIFQNRKYEDTGGWGGYRMQVGEVAGQNVNISGFHLVGEYNRKFLLGYNFNWVSSDLPYNFESRERNLRLNWHSLQLGYMLAAHKIVHPVVNLDLGIGRTKIKDVGKDRIYVASPSVGLELNLYRWFHIALEGGYRLVGDAKMAGLQDSDLSGAFGALTLKFGWSDPLSKRTKD